MHPVPAESAVRQVALVVNPTAGDGAAGVPERVASRLAEHGIQTTKLAESSRDAAMAQLRAVVELGVDAVIVIGGDGTVSDAAQELVDSPVRLATVPTGTGNDFASAIGFADATAEDVADSVAAGGTREIDVAEVTYADGSTRHLLTALATGFDARVNARGNRMGWPRGPLRYRLAVLIEFATLRPIRYDVRLDDGATESLDAVLVSVGNSPTYGGGIPICAGALVDDGLLDVTIVRPAGRLRLLRLLPRLYRGELSSIRELRQYRARRISLSGRKLVGYADGDAAGDLPVDLAVLPGALRVFTRS